MKFGRARSLKLDHKGNLEITLSNGGKLIHRVPKAFYLLNGNQRWLNSRFRIIGPDTVGFEIRGRRPGSQLTIDPIIDFGTYFGGSSDESGTSESSYFPEPKLDLDLLEDGDLLIGGTTLSTNLPEATGLISPTRNMAFAARLDPEHPSGDLFRYVSYFAGDNSDEAMGITTGPSNSAYLCGRTFSLNFPTRAAAFDVDSTLVENGAGFVLQIDWDGELFRTTFIRTVQSTKITDCVYEGATPGISAGLYFTGFSFAPGTTAATGGTLNPNVVLPGAPQSTFAGVRDALVGKLSSTLETLEYFSLLGGRRIEIAHAIAVKDGVAVITGFSSSPDFPITSTAFADHTMDSVAVLACDNSWMDWDDFVWECFEALRLLSRV